MRFTVKKTPRDLKMLVVRLVCASMLGMMTAPSLGMAAPPCASGFGDGIPTLKTIVMDGAFDDWSEVIDDPDNVACDGYVGGPQDADTPNKSSFDLIRFAHTWDDAYLYANVSRLGDGGSFDKFVFYADTDNDGKMETGEPVVAIHWKGSNRDVELEVGTYAPHTAGGDPMVDPAGKADGYALPGDITALHPLTPAHWGSADGSQMEWRVSWANAKDDHTEPGLDIVPGTVVQWHIASSNKEPDSANFPASVDDNMGGPGGYGGTNRYAAVNATPDATVPVDGGTTVSLGHTVANVGNGADTIDLSATVTPFSVSGSSPSLIGIFQDVDLDGTYDPGTDLMFPDTDGDGTRDTGSLAAGDSVRVVMAVTVPDPLSVGDTASIRLTARSSYVAPGDVTPRVFATATDTLVAETADVGLKMSVDDVSPAIGSDVTFTVIATNHGPSHVTGLRIRDSLPTGLAYVRYAGTGVYDPSTGVWDVGTVVAGASAELRLTARVGASAIPSTTNVALRTAQDERDPNGTNDTASTIVAPTHAPLANDDSYALDENSVFVVAAPGVLRNDSDEGPKPLMADLVSGPSNGTLTLQDDGGLTYVPTAHFYGTDSFTYRASDGTHLSDPATVTFAIRRVDLPPVAADDAFTAYRNLPLTISAPGVLANDTDIDGNPLIAVLASGVSHGTLATDDDGGFEYTPSPDYEGTDAFTYRASDGALTSGLATVSITIAHAHERPVAVADAYSVPKNTTLSVVDPGVLLNDTETDGDTIWPVLASSPSHGTLDLRTGGGFVYAPETGFVGTDSFTYRATDGFLDSTTVTVTIAVNAANEAPVASDDAYAVVQGRTLTVAPPGVLQNDADPDLNPLSAALVSGPSHGALSFGADGGFTYTPTADHVGTDAFSYRANDGSMHSAIATVRLTVTPAPANQAPVAVADAYAIEENGVLTVAAAGVLGNDRDADLDPISASLVTDVSFGTLRLAPDGGFTYEPKPYFDGTDTFSYHANDGAASSNAVFVTIAVTPVNYPPTVSDDEYSVGPGETITVAAPGVLTNDIDPDGDPITSAPTSGVVHGALSMLPDGSLRYAPDPGFHGADSFTYVASDASSSSIPATVTFNVRPGGGGGGGSYIPTPLEPWVDFVPRADCTASDVVTLLFHAHNADQMMIGDDPGFSGATWQPFASTLDPVSRPWTLRGPDGLKKIYVKFGIVGGLEGTSPVVSASIVLDRTGGCREMPVAAQQVDQCAYDYQDMEIHPHVVNPDRSERHEGEVLVRVTRTAPDTLRYAFDDSGSDRDYDDVILDVRVAGRKVHISVVEARADYHHAIELHVHHHGTILDDRMLWGDSHAAVGKTHVFDLDASLARCRQGQNTVLKPGDLLKGNDSTAVYYLGKDGKRHVFTSAHVYRSWYPDFSNIHRLSYEELSTLPIGANVRVRPASKLVRFMSSPRTYAVDLGGVLRWVGDEKLATDMYGPDWNSSVIVLDDSVFGDYVHASALADAASFPRAHISKQATSIEY